MPPQKPRRKPQTGVKTFRSIRPGTGIEAAYRKRLQAMLAEIHRSVLWWLSAEYKKHPPALAQDASPFTFIRRMVNKVRDRWLKAIDETAPKLAEYFSKAVQKRVDADLKKILRDGGFSVSVRPTKAMQDVQAASIEENVSLIKSIPSQYLDQVEQIIARSYSNGHDLKQVTDELQKRFKVSKKRAAFIARDQSSKLTSQVNRVRSIENGLTHALWRHSMGTREPRRTHLEMDGEPFDIREGMYDPDPKVKRMIQPGELINCFPGDVSLQFAKDVKKAFRHWFDGELSIILMETGETLRATPNHPVLTPNGWVAVGLLKKGDYVIQIANEGVFSVPPEFDNDNAVTGIGNVFDALRLGGSCEIALGADFHGDKVEGDVDVVLAAGSLSFGIEPEIAQRDFKLLLPDADMTGLSFGPGEQFAIGALYSTDSSVSGGRLRLPALGAEAIHHNFSSFAKPSPNDAVLSKDAAHNDPLVLAAQPQGDSELAIAANVSSYDSGLVDGGDLVSRTTTDCTVGDDNAALAQVSAQTLIANADNASDLDQKFSFGYKALRVVDNVRRSFSGHVYTLETASGWFAVTPSAIIVKNCGCIARMIVPGGRAWENLEASRSLGLVKPVREQKIYKGYPGKAEK